MYVSADATICRDINVISQWNSDVIKVTTQSCLTHVPFISKCPLLHIVLHTFLYFTALPVILLHKWPTVLFDSLKFLMHIICFFRWVLTFHTFLQEGKPWLCVNTNIWAGFLNKMCQPWIMMSPSPGPRCSCWVIMHYLWLREPRRHINMIIR